MVVLKGSTQGSKTVNNETVKYNWSWFDKDYSSANIPTSMKTHIQSFSTIASYEDAIVVSTMIPRPLMSGAIASYVYPSLFEDNWIQDKAGDFLQKFWGFTEEQTNGQQYVLSKAVVTGS